MIELQLDPHSAVIAVTHDPKLDDLALLEALKSPAFYVGALGSRGDTAKRKERLAMFDLSCGRDRGVHRCEARRRQKRYDADAEEARGRVRAAPASATIVRMKGGAVTPKHWMGCPADASTEKLAPDWHQGIDKLCRLATARALN